MKTIRVIFSCGILLLWLFPVLIGMIDLVTWFFLDHNLTGFYWGDSHAGPSIRFIFAAFWTLGMGCGAAFLSYLLKELLPF